MLPSKEESLKGQPLEQNCSENKSTRIGELVYARDILGGVSIKYNESSLFFGVKFWRSLYMDSTQFPFFFLLLIMCYTRAALA